MLSDNFVSKCQVAQPDSRWGSFVVVKREGGVERMDFDRWYDAVAKIECQIELSERMRKRVFEIKNLLVYSWFVYYPAGFLICPTPCGFESCAEARTAAGLCVFILKY